MNRMLVLAYGSVSYAVFLGTFLYAIGFVGNWVVPKSIDSGAPTGDASAWFVDILLLGLFAIQHSTMARHGFKQWWQRVIPAEIERSTYVLVSSLLLILLFWQWRPLSGVVWSVTEEPGRSALAAISAGGWLLVLVATFLINHFDLFGLRQVWLAFHGRAYTPVPFRVNGLYRWVRHPIMLGFVVAFWATPDMSAGHFLFALLTTGYILVGIALEERDLARLYPEHWPDYQKRTSMLLPLPAAKKNT